MAKRIHIKIADRGWILEKCASEIAARADNVSYGTDPDPSADLQYYINYSARSRRVNLTEVAFFTHSENDANARRRYFEAANDVEHCVCMSERYARELIESGVPQEKVTTIAPGVDLEEFQPKIRIGVVGRTYHTGRKGEALVAQVMDIPGIEWRFTGSGWPGQSVHVPSGAMADFYNDLDYVLVPSLYEGGPMSVLEGLACGVPIISSDVGWASEYPHIPFENGNAESLRQVLTTLVTERQSLREPVLDRTWERWADEHLKLFDRLLGGKSTPKPSKGKASGASIGVTLVTHGTESKSIGGPSVRVPRTAVELAKLGLNASLPSEHPDNFDESRIAHVFNVWPVDSCLKVLDRARSVGKRTIVSPIFLNLSNIQFAAKTLPRLFEDGRSEESIDTALMSIAAELEEEPNLPLREPFDGFHERVRACVDGADEVIVLSEYERRCLEYIGAEPRSTTLVRNPVDADAFKSGDPSPFTSAFAVEDYILCVGRIEPRKNQLVLAHAARTLDKPIVFIGHTEDQRYFELVRATAGDRGIFVPRLQPSDPLLKSAFAGASVFCLPSWAEGAPLAALEAAAAGLPLVLSDRSSEREYFGEFAEYVNPANVDAIRSALGNAASKKNDRERRQALQAYVAEVNSWESYARQTAAVYERALKSPPPESRAVQATSDTIYFDLTTTFHATGNPTGIARVEDRALRSLIAQFGDRVVPILWNGRTQSYLQLSQSVALIGVSPADLDRLEKDGHARPLSDNEATGGRILVLGGAWIRNRQYIAALQSLKRHLNAGLTLLVHDLIQMKLRHLYPEGVGDEFAGNARLMANAADDFLVYSECTRADLKDFLAANGEFFKTISKFRLGDMTGLHSGESASSGAELSQLQQRFSGLKFAIYVSTIEIRKNHSLLINVWRRLLEERGSATPHLVFIGRSLWRGNEVVDSIRRDDDLRQFVHILEDVDDRDLDWFYRNCLLTLYPSLYEGWGLPVAESLSYGKLCIASDRTATREIAPQLTDLADPYDFRAWHDRLTFYLDNSTALERAEEKIRSHYREHSWDESVSQIVSILDSLPTTKSEPAFLFPGETISFFAGSESWKGMAICAGGWSNLERTGRWSIGPASKLVFRHPAKGGEFYLRLRLWALTRPNEETRSVRVRINDQPSEIVEISGAPTVLDLTIAAQCGDGAAYSENEIEFAPVELFSPNMINGSADTRILGVYIISLQSAHDVEDLSALSAEPPPAASRNGISSSAETLKAAKNLVSVPERFTGKRPLARFARAVGFDKLWLRYHRRRFRRAYESIGLLVDYLEKEERS